MSGGRGLGLRPPIADRRGYRNIVRDPKKSILAANSLRKRGNGGLKILSAISWNRLLPVNGDQNIRTREASVAELRTPPGFAGTSEGGRLLESKIANGRTNRWYFERT